MIVDERIKYYIFCRCCYVVRMTTSIDNRSYAQCPFCHSKTKSYSTEIEKLEQFNKSLALCPKCHYIWECSITDKLRQCYKCKKIMSGKNFCINFSKKWHSDQTQMEFKILTRFKPPKGEMIINQLKENQKERAKIGISVEY